MSTNDTVRSIATRLIDYVYPGIPVDKDVLIKNLSRHIKKMIEPFESAKNSVDLGNAYYDLICRRDYNVPPGNISVLDRIESILIPEHFEDTPRKIVEEGIKEIITSLYLYEDDFSEPELYED